MGQGATFTVLLPRFVGTVESESRKPRPTLLEPV
jgi:hypothetical protein